MEYLVKDLAIVLITIVLFLNFTPAGPAAIGDLINSFPTSCGSWAGGGLAWREGRLWEICRGSCTLYQRSPITGDYGRTIDCSGDYMGAINCWGIFRKTIDCSIDRCVDLTWDGKRNCWWMTNPFAGLIVQVPYLCEPPTYCFPCTLWMAGIFYHEETDRLWIASNVNGGFGEYRPDGYLERLVNLDYTIQGIVRVGDYLWVGGPLNAITQLNLDGSPTGVSFNLPNAALMGQSLCFDGQYLWVRGQPREGYSATPWIYQFDIGYEPPPPPSPTPTPNVVVIDSGDYNGDGTSDIAIFRPSTGLWGIRLVSRIYYGGAGDIPISGDYDGDGTTDIGVFRRSSGLWAVRGVTRAYLGAASDIPVPGDYNGDGSCRAGIFRPASRLWAIQGVTRAYFGAAGDIPAPGYYDAANPRKKLIAVFRPSNGLWASPGYTRVYYGGSGDYPVPGQYNQDKDDWEIGFFRPSSGLWSILDTRCFYFGSSADQPVPADYEGDRFTDFAVFRGSSGLWAIQEVTRLYYGASGDVAVTGRVPKPPATPVPTPQPTVTPAPTAILIKSFPASGRGLTWRKGYLWENAGGTGTLYQRDPDTGAYMGTIYYSIEGDKCGDLTWDSKRGTWWLTNPFAGSIEQVPYTGGTPIGSFVCTLWIAGLFYHAETDRFWIGSNVNGGFGEYQADGSRESLVNLDYTIRGIARVGDYIWTGGPTSFCTKLNLDGSPTGVSFSLPNTGLAPSSFTFDGQYLWVQAHPREGYTATPRIYQCDIGVETPPPPIPTPTPTVAPTT